MIPNPPRSIGFGKFLGYLGYHTVLLVIGGFMILSPLILGLGLVLIINSLTAEKPSRAEILAKGQSVQGTVDDEKIVYNVTINDDHPRQIDFTYPNNGQDQKGDVWTMSHDADNLGAGQKIEVKYLENRAILPDYEPMFFPWWVLGCFGGLFALPVATIGLVIWVGCSIDAYKKTRLLRLGNVTRELVMAVRATPFLITLFGGSKFKITYERPNGQMPGEAYTNDATFAAQTAPGTQIEMLTLPMESSALVLDAATRKRLI
jgi:hypothetical protein